MKKSKGDKRIVSGAQASQRGRVIDLFTGEYFFLSNFYQSPVEFDGIVYQNSEAAFQAHKCINRADREQFAYLTPSQAKLLGRSVQLRGDWEQVKFDIMKEIVRAKFEQCPEIAEKLLATGDARLEEGNTWGDRTWGTVRGVGSNHLGRILMEVREEMGKKA